MYPASGVRRLVAGLLALLITATACDSSTTRPDDSPVSLHIRAALGAAVALVVVQVTAEDITTPLAFTLPVVDEQIDGTIIVPAGSDRTITVRVYDDGGIETHRGATTVDLVPGTNPTLELRVFPLTGEQPIVVTITSVTLAVSPTAHTMFADETVQLVATITDAEGEPVTGTVGWATLDPAVAIVDANGVVTARRPGTATIVATFAGLGVGVTITVPENAGASLSLLTDALIGPVGMAMPPDDPSRIFVVQQSGVIGLVKEGSLVATPTLDIRSRVLYGGEQGMLGIVFHPDYATNRHFFVQYSSTDGTRIARYTMTPGGDVADPASELVLLTVPQPALSHKGGQLAFGPDGMLYIALGDGGDATARENAQNLGLLLGKMIRIDVDGGSPYAIPPDNPFVGVAGARGEIWARGLRNPWRFSFDRETGDLYIADVGEGAWEEVNIVASGTGAGANFGWPIMEGPDCFQASSCDRIGLTVPAYSYGRSEGCAVIGGYVYRGKRISSLARHYLYTDTCSGWVRSFRWTNGTISDHADWTADLPAGNFIVSFAEAPTGELYMLKLDGELYAIEPASP